MKHKPKAIVSLSGGIDSCVTLAQAVRNYEVLAVRFSYGSRQDKIEEIAASRIAEHYGVAYATFDISRCFAFVSSPLLKHQVNSDYEIPGEFDEGGMEVPLRNFIFIGILASIAQTLDTTTIFLGLQDGENSPYKDCSPEFVRHVEETLCIATKKDFKVEVPFMFTSKSGLLLSGFSINAPLELTRSCYYGLDPACGKCEACTKRLAAFEQVGKEDPIEYTKED